MKKIMFNDQCGLTTAVLEGRKTMTRRIVPKGVISLCEQGMYEMALGSTKYKVGEDVAVAQCYKDAGYDAMLLQTAFVKSPTIFPELDPYDPVMGWCDLPMKCHKGWNNKMFIYPTMMPHQIRITNICVERLQDISDEDILREGIEKDGDIYSFNDYEGYKTPQLAFKALINRISGKGTWASNPWVFVYEFELVE